MTHTWYHWTSRRRSLIVMASLLAGAANPPAGHGQSPDLGAAIEMLRRMDTNGDGQLEANEVPERSRFAVQRLAEQARLDTSGPIPIDRLERQISRQSGDSESRNRDRRRGGPNGPDSGGGWGGPGGFRPPGGDSQEGDPRGGGPRGDWSQRGGGFPGGGGPGDWSQRGGGFPGGGGPGGAPEDRTARFAERILSQNDRNGNGQLEGDELANLRGVDPKESDQNGDGALTRDELMQGMANRWGNRSGSGEDRGGRGRSRGRDNGGERGPEGRDAERRGPGGRDRGPFGGGPPSGDGDGGDRMQRFAEGMLNRYDENKNGSLEKSEWTKMRERYHSADTNKDGTITQAELAALLAQGAGGPGGPGNWGPGPGGPWNSGPRPGSAGPAGGGTVARRGPTGFGTASNERSSERTALASGNPTNKKSYRFLTPAERLSTSLSSDRLREGFMSLDKDGDGQIAMSEYASTWSEDKVAEFTTLDQDRDGTVTPKEYAAARSN